MHTNTDGTCTQSSVSIYRLSQSALILNSFTYKTAEKRQAVGRRVWKSDYRSPIWKCNQSQLSFEHSVSIRWWWWRRRQKTNKAKWLRGSHPMTHSISSKWIIKIIFQLNQNQKTSRNDKQARARYTYPFSTRIRWWPFHPDGRQNT